MGAGLSFVGNLVAASLLLGGDLITSSISWVVRKSVDIVDFMCGSGHNTCRRKVAWHKQRYATEPVYSATGNGSLGELDVLATLAKSTFPIKPDDLIEKTREVIRSQFGTAPGGDASCLAEDFQFVAPIIGPLSKKEFVKAFGSFKLMDAVPDLKDNSWLQVDPLEPNRVWMFGRPTGRQTGPMAAFGLAATGKEIRLPPLAQSLLFNEQGKCYTLTIGYCMDKRIGDTEGLGGLFGILKAVGRPLPFPEGKRLYNPSLRYEAFEHVMKAFEGFTK